MLDYQRIVDDVRSLLDADGSGGMDFLRAAAADYSVACDEVNERLRQCGSLLRQGLRSEAIQFGEIDPNVLDVVAILDFPEHEQWITTSERHGMAPPTPLMLDVAAALNEAYAVEQPLASLLQYHRLLALARSPLPLRIQVLRRLSKMDINNPVWHEDLQTFEQERQKQLQAEVETAERMNDTAALDRLDAELSSPDWSNPPPPVVAKSATKAKETLHYWTVQSQLEELATDLDSAMSSGRLDLGQTLYKRWNETIGQSGWQPHDQLAQRVDPALNWVREHLNREAALASLTRAVRDEGSAARLQELYDRATKYGNLPTELEERYCSRLATVQRAARRLWWLKIAGAVVSVVAVMFIIGWFVSREHYEREVATAEKNLPFFIERGELERAESLVKQLSDRAKHDPRLQVSLNLLEDKLKHEGGRQSGFAQCLGAANHWLEQVRKSLANESDQTVLNRLHDELERIQTDLAHAKELARTEQDRAQVVSADEFAMQLKEKMQRQLDQVFRNQYEDFDKRLTQVERDVHSSHQEQTATIADYRGSLRKWETASTGVSPALTTRISTLGERLATLEKRSEQQGREELDEKKITVAIGDIQGYMKALQEYIQRNPNSDCVADFKRVAEESLCWQSMAEWNKLAAPWRQAVLAGLRPSKAEEQLALAKVVSENFTDCSECEGLRKLLPYLKAIAQRDNGGERIETPLKKLFDDPLVNDTWMVEIETDAVAGEKGSQGKQRFYFREQPTITKDSPTATTFHYVCGFDGKTKMGFLKQNNRVRYVGRAPQVAVAEQIQPILKALNDDNWERSFCKMLAIIHADRAMDPILKVNLLQQVLDAGIRGSHCLEKTFGPHLEWIKDAKINPFANWLDPNDSTFASVCNEAERKLKDFPDVHVPTKAAAQDFKTKRQLTEFRWVGWLHRSRDGRWECLMNSTPDAAGSLLVVCRQPTGGKLAMNAIGRFDRKSAVMDVTAGPSLVEGRPVYLKMP